MRIATTIAAAALVAMLGPALAQQPPSPPAPGAGAAAAPPPMPGDAAARMPHAPDVPMQAMAPHQPAYDPNHGPGPNRLPDGTVPSRPDELQLMTRRGAAPGMGGMGGGQPAHVRLSKGDASVDLACGDLGPQACLDAAAKALTGISAAR